MSGARETLPISTGEIFHHTTSEEYESAIATLDTFARFDFMLVRDSDHLGVLKNELYDLVPALQKIVLYKGESEYVSTEVAVIGPHFTLGYEPLEVVASSGEVSTQYRYLWRYFLEGSPQTSEGNSGHIRINYQELPHWEQTEICKYKPNGGLIYRVGLPSRYTMGSLGAQNSLGIAYSSFAADRRSNPRMIYTPFTEDPQMSEVEGYSNMLQEAIRDVRSVLPRT